MGNLMTLNNTMVFQEFKENVWKRHLLATTQS